MDRGGVMPQLRTLLTALLLLMPLPCFAALQATVNFDVRTTGADTNAGCFDPGVASPGTDYSQQNSPQVTYSDLVIGATNTQLTSAGNPFSSASVGNCVKITGGTGFTAGTYEVLSVSGSTATMDRAVGTASSTGGVGLMGGSKLTIGNAVATMAPGNTVWIQSGTYTITATISLNAYSLYGTFEGYASTHGDMGTRPLITSATNSLQTFLLYHNNISYFINLNMSSTAATRGEAFHSESGTGLYVIDCQLSGFQVAIDGDYHANYFFNPLGVVNSEILNSVGSAIVDNQGAVVTLSGDYIHNNGGSAFTDLLAGAEGPVTLTVTRSLLVNNGGYGINQTSGTNSTTISYSTIADNTLGGVAIGGTAFNLLGTVVFSLNNDIFYGNGSYGVSLVSGSVYLPSLQTNNAYGANSTGAKNNFADTAPVTLTADPFTNDSGGNFALNSTAGGGALLKQTGYPGLFPGGTTQGYLDIGATQSQGAGGGGTTVNYSGYAY